MITVGDITTNALNLLGDPAAARWTKARLYGYIGPAARQIASIRPDMAGTQVTATLVAGSKQTVPDTLLMFGGAVSNSDGSVIRNSDAVMMDAGYPDWRTVTQSATIKDCMYRADRPGQFEVYPPAIVSTEIVVSGVAAIADVDGDDDTIPLDQSMETGLLHLTLYYAYMENTGATGGANPAIASAHLQQAIQAIGGDAASRLTFPPKHKGIEE